MAYEQDVPLAGLTTLGVGGPARWLARCDSEAAVAQALAWGRERGLRTFVLGGGSNLLVADTGFDGLVIQPEADALDLVDGGATVLLRADAGVDWDHLVATATAEGLAGVECLSGIPGRVGAAPIQNIGAYGQEVAEVVRSVRVVDRRSGAATDLSAESCGFGYRQSRFKGEWRDRFVITRVDFELRRGGPGPIRYGELARRLGGRLGEPSASLEEVRGAVLDLRRSKSMVLEPAAEGTPKDPNRRSAGSFFVNPVVDTADADDVARRAVANGSTRGLPRFPAGPGRVKLSAAWLIEEAGFPRGYARGPAGLSTRHTLALVNRGGADAHHLVSLAREIRTGVQRVFGVTLVPEPVFLGFDEPF
ncbi:MAG: UDP-N-acetylmuramate dehydrogenase [Acidobacteriota bacterium]